MEQRIGILGGTFNPIHYGHIAIAEAVRQRFRLSQIIFIPCHIPSHKSQTYLAPANHRLEMVKHAIKTKPYFTVSDIEIKRGGVSYSIDTLKYLKKTYPPNTKFWFIIGSDNLKELASWRDIKLLKKLCRFVIVARPGSKLTHAGRYYLKEPVSEISSCQIRKRLREKKSIKYFVPLEVARYIKKHRLYQ